MQSHAHIITVLDNESINQTPDERQPLLDSQESHHVTRPDPIPLPKKSFLLDDIEECIKILEQAKTKNLIANIKKHQGRYRLCTLFCMLTILMSAGVSSAMFGVMWIMTKRLLKDLGRSLQEKEAEISADQQVVDYLQSEDAVINAQVNSAYQNEENIDYSWEAGPVDTYPGDDCVVWTDAQGNTVYIYDVFPDYDGSYCYFQNHGVEHPLPVCNDLANKGCIVEEELRYLFDRYSEVEESFAHEENDIAKLNEEVGQIEKKLHHPLEQFEPLSTTFFAISAVVAVGALILLTIKWNKNRKELNENKNKEHVLFRCLPPHQVNKIINLAERIKIPHVDQMKIDDFLDILKNAAKLQRIKIKKVGYFLKSPSTQKLIENDASFDVTRMIMRKAELIP